MKEKITAGNVWRIIYPILIHSAISTLCVRIWFEIMTVVLSKTGEYKNYDEVITKIRELAPQYALGLTLLTSLITIPIMIFFRRRDIYKEKENNLYIKYKQIFLPKYILIVPFGIFCMMAGNYFTSMLTLFMSESMISTYDSAQTAIYGSSFALQVIAAGIVGPIAEEMVFRGLLYNRIKKISGVIVAAVLSSIIFGVYHKNWIQAPYAMIIGLVCVYVYEKYNSIIAPILLHISANMFSLIISRIAMYMAGEQTVTPSLSQQFTSLIVMTLIMGCLALLFGKIIDKTVKLKEI